jgi:tetratricopeptide (TPR) repeat protein
MLALVVGLGLTLAACGKYSINNLRALQAFQDANEKYKRSEFKNAADDYERVLALSPDSAVAGYAYFFLGNSYDNLYKPAKKGDQDNDAYLPKAVDNYRKAIDRLAGNTDPRGPEIRKLSFEYLIAAYGTDKLNDLSQAVPIAQQLIAQEPNEPTNYQALGKLYEDAGRYEEAEAQFKKAIEVRPSSANGYAVLAGYYDRQGEFEKMMEAWYARAKMEPNNPEAWQAIGSEYQGEVFKNKKLTPAKAKEYVTQGLDAEDKALALNGEYFEALSYKNILLRQEALLEKDPAKQKQLLQQADDLRSKATDVQRKQNAAAASGASKKGGK